MIAIIVVFYLLVGLISALDHMRKYALPAWQWWLNFALITLLWLPLFVSKKAMS